VLPLLDRLGIGGDHRLTHRRPLERGLDLAARSGSPHHAGQGIDHLIHQTVHPGQAVIKDGTTQLTDAGAETAAALAGQMAGHHTQQRTL